MDIVSTPPLDAVTEEEVARLPVLLSVVQAARVLGVGRTLAYRLVRCGQWPTPVIRMGNAYRIPRAPLLALVRGASTDPGSDSPGPSGSDMLVRKTEGLER